MSDFIRQMRGPIPHEMDSISDAQREFMRPPGYISLLSDLLYRANSAPTAVMDIPNSAGNPERGVIPPAPEESGYDPMMPHRTTRKI